MGAKPLSINSIRYKTLIGMTQTHGKTRYELAHERDQSSSNKISFMIAYVT
jgi:hypothetical protein